MASAKQIPPGGEGKIDVTFKTERRKGINKKKITVTSNDPTNPRLQLEIIADLEQMLDVTPRRQWFGRIKQEDTLTKTFKLEGKKVPEVKLGTIKLKGDEHKNAYTWKVKDETTAEGRLVSIDVTLEAKHIAPGRFNDILIVDTNLEEAPNLELVVSGEILGPITIEPKRLYFGQYELNQEMVKTITFKANNGIPFKISQLSITDKEFKIEPWSREAALEHVITVKLNPKLDRDRIRSVLSVTTDMEKQPSIEVDIHSYKRRSRPGPNPNSKTAPNQAINRAKPIGGNANLERSDMMKQSRRPEPAGRDK